MSRTEPDLVAIPKRDLVELFETAIKIREHVDGARRLGVDANATYLRMRAILSRVAPELVLEVEKTHEVTPVEVPKPPTD